MSENKVNVIVPKEYNGKPIEVVIRKGEAPEQLEPRAPLKIQLTGVIGAPFEFLQKRIDQPDQINQKRCHVLINREKLKVYLAFNENDDYTSGFVLGILEQHPKFKEFGINQPKLWEPNELGQFFKMNRAFFADKAENMALVTQLKNFEAKVNTIIEKQKSDNGDFKDNYSGVVCSSLPGSFKLKIPLFKGRPAEEIEIEFYASVNGRNVSLQLFSPGACQALEDIRDQIIEEEINKIKEIAPNIAIIEQ